jgi:hypothetical protein
MLEGWKAWKVKAKKNSKEGLRPLEAEKLN